jgi:hypothetical protein
MRCTDQQTMRHWVSSIRLLLRERQDGHSYVADCDETCWRLDPNEIMARAKMCTDGVSLDIRR